MTRALFFCLKVALLVALAYWLAQRPGTVAIQWLGYRIETTVGLLVLAVGVFAALVALLYRLWRFLRRAPGGVGRSMQTSRRRRGYKALTQGMVAVAAGEADEAARLAKRADSLLDEPPLTMLLSAQAAQLNGDEAAAKRYFNAMLERDETRFLGLRGLLTLALREGDDAAALDYARQARALRPRTPWVLTSLFELSERAGDLETARRAIDEAARAKALPAPEAERKRAVLALERARAARAGGERQAALAQARAALKHAPALTPAATLAADLLIEEGQRRKALKLLERAWAAAPHPDLARAYLHAQESADAIERLKALHRLVGARPDHPESHLALARAALAAQLWGEARRHLASAAGDGGLEGHPREAVCRLMAELEDSERADAAAARAWLTRAASAPPDPAWVCGACGAVAGAWSARCGACDAFDTLAWKPPPRVEAHLTAPAPAARPGARADDKGDNAKPARLPVAAPAPPAPAGAVDAPRRLD